MYGYVTPRPAEDYKSGNKELVPNLITTLKIMPLTQMCM